MAGEYVNVALNRDAWCAVSVRIFFFFHAFAFRLCIWLPNEREQYTSSIPRGEPHQHKKRTTSVWTNTPYSPSAGTWASGMNPGCSPAHHGRAYQLAVVSSMAWNQRRATEQVQHSTAKAVSRDTDCRHDQQQACLCGGGCSWVLWRVVLAARNGRG